MEREREREKERERSTLTRWHTNQSANNVTGTLTYSASDEIYHDSNKWVKELKSLRKDGLETLSERPQLAYSVKVPIGLYSSLPLSPSLPLSISPSHSSLTPLTHKHHVEVRVYEAEYVCERQS